MKTTDAWREALSPDQPVFTNGTIERFENLADEIVRAQTESTKSPSASGIVQISGKDALDFVHAQFTGDCLSLGQDDSLLTSWCNPKGRVTHLVRIVRQHGTVYALVPLDQTRNFCNRLSMFVLRAEIKLEDLSKSHGAIVENPPISSEEPRPKWHVQSLDALNDVWSQLDVTPVGIATTRLMDIRRGLPQLAAGLSEQFLPQELNLDALRGVSYEKGCYPGQEIIARVKFRGTVKRRMQRLRVRINAAPTPGDKIVSKYKKKAIGRVLYAAQIDSSATEMLAVLEVGADEFVLEKYPESPLALEFLPYSFDS